MRADDGQRVRLRLEQQQLQHAVAQVAGALVLRALRKERGGVELGELTAAGQLHLHAERDRRVLYGEEAGAVTGQLGLARPLVQRGDDRPDAQCADRHPVHRAGQPHQPEQQRLVERVPALSVTELVAEDEPQLLLVEPLQQRAVDDDDRLVQADRERVPDRAVGDVELRQLPYVERAARLGVEPVHPRELALVDPDRRSEELQPHGALVDQPGDLPQHEVEALELPQRHQGTPVRRVLPRARTDVRQRRPCVLVGRSSLLVIVPPQVGVCVPR